jgi:hypothetical protein
VEAVRLRLLVARKFRPARSLPGLIAGDGGGPQLGAVAVAPREQQVLIRGAARRGAAVVELGQAPVLDRDQSLIRAALLLDGAGKPRPGLPVGPQGCEILLLGLARPPLRARAWAHWVADQRGSLVRELAVVVVDHAGHRLASSRARRPRTTAA